MEKIRKPRVLLTGFTPFGGETVNPALEAVKRVRCPEAELRILEVPTVSRCMKERLLGMLKARTFWKVLLCESTVWASWSIESPSVRWEMPTANT